MADRRPESPTSPGRKQHTGPGGKLEGSRNTLCRPSVSYSSSPEGGSRRPPGADPGASPQQASERNKGAARTNRRPGAEGGEATGNKIPNGYKELPTGSFGRAMTVMTSLAQQRKKRGHHEPHQEGKNPDRTGARRGRGHSAAAAGQARRLDATYHDVSTRNRSAAGRARGGPEHLNSLIYQRN